MRIGLIALGLAESGEAECTSALREALIASGNADGYAARDLLTSPSMSKAITSAQCLELEAFVRMCGQSAGAIPRHFHSQLTATSDRAARPDAARTALPASAGDRKRSIRVSAVMITLVWGCLSLLPVPDSCRVLRADGQVTGAHGARAAAPQAPLTRPPGSGSCQAATRQGAPGGGYGSAVQAGGLSVRVTCRGGRGRGQEQPSLS